MLRVTQNPALKALKPKWQTWDSLAINIRGVPDEATAFTLWKAFQRQGVVAAIDLYEDANGRRNGRGRIRFRLVSFFFLFWGGLARFHVTEEDMLMQDI